MLGVFLQACVDLAIFFWNRIGSNCVEYMTVQVRFWPCLGSWQVMTVDIP